MTKEKRICIYYTDGEKKLDRKFQELKKNSESINNY